MNSDVKRLEAEGFVCYSTHNGKNRWRAENNFFVMAVCFDENYTGGISFLVTKNDHKNIMLHNIKTVDDVLTLARLLGLSKEVE